MLRWSHPLFHWRINEPWSIKGFHAPTEMLGREPQRPVAPRSILRVDLCELLNTINLNALSQTLSLFGPKHVNSAANNWPIFWAAFMHYPKRSWGSLGAITDQHRYDLLSPQAIIWFSCFPRGVMGTATKVDSMLFKRPKVSCTLEWRSLKHGILTRKLLIVSHVVTSRLQLSDRWFALDIFVRWVCKLSAIWNQGPLLFILCQMPF